MASSWRIPEELYRVRQVWRIFLEDNDISAIYPCLFGYESLPIVLFLSESTRKSIDTDRRLCHHLASWARWRWLQTVAMGVFLSLDALANSGYGWHGLHSEEAFAWPFGA